MILIELKRERTPRAVVAQAINYATFVGELKPEDIVEIYANFALATSRRKIDILGVVVNGYCDTVSTLSTSIVTM